MSDFAFVNLRTLVTAKNIRPTDNQISTVCCRASPNRKLFPNHSGNKCF